MKIKILQRQNLGELEKATNEFSESHIVISINISIISMPTGGGVFSGGPYRQYYYACIVYKTQYTSALH